MSSGLKKSLSVACVICFLVTAGCRDDKNAEKQKISAIINGYELTLDEYEAKLARELDYTREYKTTPEARAEFLETLIQKEILIQEATRLGLEKKTEFIQAIEKYWEATLIKTLMEEKIKEISPKILVRDEEIKSYYAGMKSEDKTLPTLEQIESDVAKRLKEEKKTHALDYWINDMRKKARVEINKQYL